MRSMVVGVLAVGRMRWQLRSHERSQKRSGRSRNAPEGTRRRPRAALRSDPPPAETTPRYRNAVASHAAAKAFAFVATSFADMPGL